VWGSVRGHRKVGAEERHRVLEVGRRRTEGSDAGVHHIDLVVERRRVVAVGMDYAKVRHREAVEADIPGAAVEDSHAAVVEGILGAVGGGSVLVADSLEEGRRSPVVVGGILGEDTGLGEVVGSPLGNDLFSIHSRNLKQQSHVVILRRAGVHLGVDRT
jgi:hypothetical protein